MPQMGGSKTGGTIKIEGLDPVNIPPRLYLVCWQYAPEGVPFDWSLYEKLCEDYDLDHFLDLEEAMVVTWTRQEAAEFNHEGHKIDAG